MDVVDESKLETTDNFVGNDNEQVIIPQKEDVKIDWSGLIVFYLMCLSDVMFVWPPRGQSNKFFARSPTVTTRTPENLYLGEMSGTSEKHVKNINTNI